MLTKIVVPEISIIVPVYNVEKYLERCLDSIFNQKFSGSFEVISVEDYSTDNSLEVLKEYQKRFPELIIIEHEVNKKLAQARTTGMKVAQGAYIMHVDSDDWLLPNALESVYLKCLESGADVLVYNYLIENEKGEQVFLNKIKEETVTSDKLKVQNHFFGACWTKIVKRELIEDMVYFNAITLNTEDLIYCSEILLRANKIHLLPQDFYAYFKNSQSITNSTNPQKYLNNQIVILTILDKICVRYNPNNAFQSNLLDYFEKWIYLELCKTHFWNKEDVAICKPIFEELFNIQLLDKVRVGRLRISINNKYKNLFEIIKRFGLRLTLGILYRSFRKNK